VLLLEVYFNFWQLLFNLLELGLLGFFLLCSICTVLCFASSGRLILALLWGFSCKAIQLAAHFLVAHLQQLECFFPLLLFITLELGCFILPISSFSIS